MTEERQQELKSLLVSNDFHIESYKPLDMQEIIILRNTAEGLRKENEKDENAAKFFEAKGKFLYGVVLEKLKVLDEMFVLFAQATRMPYVYCDENTFNDQVWVFSREVFAQNEAKKLQEKKIPVQILKFTTDQFLAFYVNLYPIGINAIVVDHGINIVEIQLEDLCRRPDYSKLPKENVPVLNPQLHLTALYYMQELRREVEPEMKADVKEMEEEMLVNLNRGTFLLPIHLENLKEGEEAPKELTADSKNIRVPFIKYDNDTSYQPVFTDPGEFHKFNKDKNFRAISVAYHNLGKLLSEQANGIVINPMGFNLLLNRRQLETETKGE